MHEVKCDLCGADDYTVLFPKDRIRRHRVVRCNRCGLMYANPQESVDCEEFQSDARAQVFDEKAGRQYLQKQQVQLPDNLRALRVLDELAPRRGKLLEIGSFCGIFLDRIRADGWEATGLEPDPGPADYARKKYGLNIIDGVLPSPEIPEHSFDVVVMLHVIEHMPSPATNLQEIHRILKPGGVLVVETPRFDSLMFKLLGRRERSLANSAGHIFFFTTSTLKQMLQKAGFEVTRVDLVGRTLTAERFLYNVCLVTRFSWLGRRLESLSLRLRLDRIRFHLNVRDMQRQYCRA